MGGDEGRSMSDEGSLSGIDSGEDGNVNLQSVLWWAFTLLEKVEVNEKDKEEQKRGEDRTHVEKDGKSNEG